MTPAYDDADEGMFAGAPGKAAKKAWGVLKKSPGAAFHAAKDFKKFLDKAIPDLTSWDGIAPW